MTRRFRSSALRLPTMGALCLAVIAAAAGCGSSSSSSSTQSAASAGASSSAAAPASGKSVHIAMELIVGGLPFEAETQAGAQAAAKQFGATLSVSAPTSFDPSTAISQVNNALSQGAQGVAIADEPPSLWTRALTNAVSQTHGDAVTFNVVPPAGAPVKTYVGNNDLALGQSLASTTIKAAHLGPATTGPVLISNCNPTAAPVGVTVRGMVQTVKQLLPKATIEPVFNSQIAPSQNFTAWRQEVSAHPGAVLALGACDQDDDSMIKAKQASGGKFAIGATDVDPLVLAGITNGTVVAAVAQNWYVEGYLSARMLIEAIRNHKTPPAGWFQPGTSVVTKSNVAALTARDASSAGMDEFYAPIVSKEWGALATSAQPVSEAQKIG